MQSLNSDQLRKLLKKHTRKMNWLAEQNDLIVATLKQRGLQAVDPAGDDISIHPCIMQLDKLQSEPKPLTADELKAGGWWCADVSEECRLVFDDNGVDSWSESWNDNAHVHCAYNLGSDSCVLRAHGSIDLKNLKQIHRIGNNFYWGAASDQAN